MTPLWPKLLCSDILTHSKVCTNPEHLQACLSTCGHSRQALTQILRQTVKNTNMLNFTHS